MADRPPIADIDYTAAVEAAAEALCDQADGDGEPHDHYWMACAAAAVDAVWPILHAAAYGEGRASVQAEVEQLQGELAQAREEAAAWRYWSRAEYGVFEDRTSDGLGHALIRTFVTQHDAEQHALVWPTRPGNQYPAYVKWRATSALPWVAQDETVEEGSR
jgi:hypothetical protein